MEKEFQASKRKVGFLLGIGIFLIPFIFVWFLLRKGHSNVSRAIGFGWLAVLVIISMIPKAPEQPNASPQQSAISEIKPQISYQIPPGQSNLISTVNDFVSPYRNAPNELKKSALRTQRGNSLGEALGNSRQATDWVGTIKSMSTNNEGKAILEIALLQNGGTPIMVKTWNNALSDIMDNTLIPQESSLFTAISELSKNDLVYFSGNFLVSDKSDFIKEGSLTELGSMTEPEFLFRFKSVKRIQ